MTSKIDIKKLIIRCRKQDWAAQKELYLLFADDMMSIAVRYASDMSSAKDLVQETFLAFFKKIDQYDESRGAPGAWLSRILINAHFTQFRKKQRLVLYGDDLPFDEVSTDTSPLETLEAEDILKLLHDLPQGCRDIFNLKVVEGYSHADIGDLLSITASASRAQLTRAKKLLRVMISEREPSDNYRLLKSKRKRV